jgi:hypothetical protein
MGTKLYPEPAPATASMLISSTSISGSLSTSISLPSGYVEFKFFQYSEAISGVTDFTYTFNNNTSSIYPNVNSSYRTSMQPMGYVYSPSSTPLATDFRLKMPDQSIKHMVDFTYIILGSSVEKNRYTTGMASAEPITSIQVIANSVNHTGTFYVYGIK